MNEQTKKTGVDDVLMQKGADAVKKIVEDAEKENDKPIQARQLLSLAESVELFKDLDGVAYGTIPLNDHKETWPIRSKGFKSWLTREFYFKENKPPSSQALQDSLGVIEARALYEGPTVSVFIRIAGHGEKIYLDLCNEKWEVVEIDANGWRIITNPPVRFRRSRGMLSISSPISGGSISDLWPIVNIKDDGNRKLYVGYLISAMRPTGPYPVLNLGGVQGSAKSTAARVAKALLDPSTTPLRALPRNEEDLMIAAKNSGLLCYDNVSGIPTWLSDAFARLATGGGLSTRELYTNQEESLFNAQRPIILNGIDENVTRGDLVERSIKLYLPKISKSERREEKELWAKLEEVRSQILGALLDAVSMAIKNISSITMAEKPRMADAAVWVAASESAFGWKKGSFLNAYMANYDDSFNLALEDDLVACAVISFMEDRESEEPWCDTATNLLKSLSKKIEDQNLLKDKKRWPQGATSMSNRLRRAIPLLEIQRYQVEMGGEGNREAGTGRRLITIRRSTQKPVTPVTNVTSPDSKGIERDDAPGAIVTPVTGASQEKPSSNGSCDNCDDSDSKLHNSSESSEFDRLMDGI